jgi:hypothetical protein
MQGREARNQLRTRQPEVPPTAPTGMQSYQANDYFCRRTYESPEINDQFEIANFPFSGDSAFAKGTFRAKPGG